MVSVVVVVVVVVVKRQPKAEERETTPDHIDPPGNPAVRQTVHGDFVYFSSLSSYAVCTFGRPHRN